MQQRFEELCHQRSRHGHFEQRARAKPPFTVASQRRNLQKKRPCICKTSAHLASRHAMLLNSITCTNYSKWKRSRLLCIRVLGVHLGSATGVRRRWSGDRCVLMKKTNFIQVFTWWLQVWMLCLEWIAQPPTLGGSQHQFLEPLNKIRLRVIIHTVEISPSGKKIIVQIVHSSSLNTTTEVHDQPLQTNPPVKLQAFNGHCTTRR